MKRTSNHNRSLLNHGPGKGDKSRVDDVAAYDANLAAISFSGLKASEDPDFKKRGGKCVKTYGAAPAPTMFEVLTSKLIIH